MSASSLRRAAVAAGLILTAAVTAAASPLVREKPAQEGGYQISSVLSLGGADAAEASDFYERYGSVQVDADADGNIYVLDNGNVRVQKFDPKGRLVKSLGSEGDGPGEFRIPGTISVNAAGDFAVFDMGQGRVSVLDADGKLLFDLLTPGMVKNLVLTDDRHVLLGFGDTGPAAVQAFGPDGKLLWSGGTRNEPSGPHIEMEIGVQTVAPRLAVLKSGAAFRCPKGDYLLQRFVKGDETEFARPLERRAFSAEDLSPPEDEEGGEPQVIMIRREGPGGGGHGSSGGAPSGKATFTQGEEGAESITFDMDDLKSMMPTHHSATRGVLSWPDGRLWVLTSEKGRSGNEVDEWSESGEWMRRFELPAEYDWLQVGRDGQLYGVTHDEDDYPTVHRLAVRTGA